MTLTACLRGVLPLESNHACNFPTLSSCVVTAVGTQNVESAHKKNKVGISVKQQAPDIIQ